METIKTAMTTAMTTIQGDAMTVISEVVPIALVIVGAFLVVKLGIKAFKMITGQ